MLHGDVTELIIKAFFKVYNTLGYGFLEKVYENAMRIELSKMGLNVYNRKISKYFMKQIKLVIISQIYS
jgi:GxxExxY protein